MTINKRLFKRIVDIFMTILYLLLFSYQWTGNLIHEILGIALFILFVVHNILNAGWYKSTFKGKYSVFPVFIVELQ